MKPVITDIIDGIRYEFDSAEEMWFAWWLEELKRHGVVKAWHYQEATFGLSEPLHVLWQIEGKRKMLDKSRSVLRSHSYTADFSFFWTAQYLHLINRAITTIGNDGPKHQSARIVPPYRPDALFLSINPVSDNPAIHVDVKGAFIRADSQERKFSLIQGLVWTLHHQYINKVVPYNPKGEMLVRRDLCSATIPADRQGPQCPSDTRPGAPDRGMALTVLGGFNGIFTRS